MDYSTFLQLRELLQRGACGDIQALIKAGYANNCGTVTQAGIDAMQPYEVTRAIFMAAGMGSRAVPFTYEAPKGMIRINDEAMIEREISQLKQAGIDDIWLITGYMPEGYAHLADKYGVRFLNNPRYNSINNIGTIYTARYLMDRNMYLLNVDNYLQDNIFHRYEYNSWYAAPYAQGRTNEWCLTLDDNGLIKRVDIGGKDAYIMGGPSYFRMEFAVKLARYATEYMRDASNFYMYWEHIYIENIAELPLYANTLSDAALEFETLEELRQCDASYADDTGNKHMLAISSALDIQQADIRDVRPLPDGLFTRRFSFKAGGREYVHLYYDKDAAALIQGVSSLLPELEVPGSYLLECVSPSRAQAAQAMSALRNWHEERARTGAAQSLLKRIGANSKQHPQKYNHMLEAEHFALESAPIDDRLLIHGAFCPDNCLVSDGAAAIIEDVFGYVADKLVDVAFYCVCGGGDLNELLSAYLQREPTSNELERSAAYAAASALALHIRYSALQSDGIDCADAVERYLSICRRYIEAYEIFL